MVLHISINFGLSFFFLTVDWNFSYSDKFVHPDYIDQMRQKLNVHNIRRNPLKCNKIKWIFDSFYVYLKEHILYRHVITLNVLFSGLYFSSCFTAIIFHISINSRKWSLQTSYGGWFLPTRLSDRAIVWKLDKINATKEKHGEWQNKKWKALLRLA